MLRHSFAFSLRIWPVPVLLLMYLFVCVSPSGWYKNSKRHVVPNIHFMKTSHDLFSPVKVVWTWIKACRNGKSRGWDFFMLRTAQLVWHVPAMMLFLWPRPGPSASCLSRCLPGSGTSPGNRLWPSDGEGGVSPDFLEVSSVCLYQLQPSSPFTSSFSPFLSSYYTNMHPDCRWVLPQLVEVSWVMEMWTFP